MQKKNFEKISQYLPFKLEELWEQFDTTIHCNIGLNFIEKLMYLQDALKDGPVRFVTQGLTRTSKSYEEAIKCLKEQYNQPQLVMKNTSTVLWMQLHKEQQQQGASPSL